MTRKQFVVFALIVGTFGGSASAQSRQRRTVPARAPVRTVSAQEWKVLLIIKRMTRVDMPGVPKVEAAFTDKEIEAVSQAFTQGAPRLVHNASGGRIVWKPSVVVSPFPLETVSKIGDGHWVAPQDVTKDYERFVSTGQYDGVLFYWIGVDPSTGADLQGGFGWSIGPGPASKYAGHTCVHAAPAESWAQDPTSAGIFVHEWLHQLEAYYGERGIKLPKDGLHGAEAYGFTARNGWMDRYEAFLRREVKEPDGSRSGLGESAWALGTIREGALAHTPGFLTPQRLRNNLLSDGSFERSTGALQTDPSLHWVEKSWRGRTGVARIDGSVAKTGVASAYLRTEAGQPPDAIAYQRQVRVKPHTRYLLAGWIKTKDVTDLEKCGTLAGALLSIDDAYEATGSLIGSNDWTYRSVEFDTAGRTEIKVGCRLSHICTTGTGEAWFDGLVLIELSPGRRP